MGRFPCFFHATVLAVRSRTATIAVGLTRIRVDRNCSKGLQHAGLTKPTNAYFGYQVDYEWLPLDAIFLPNFGEAEALELLGIRAGETPMFLKCAWSLW